ncbi:MAG: hypothetical protein HKN48_11670 [Flavobacteriaceae bacterium]|nr:hypothetical protein [Flavobacteriaceae bacterium]
MKYLRISLLILILPICISFTAHKFYVSITKIEYVEEEQALQIISKLFVEDVEAVLQERYSKSASLDPEKETPADAEFLKRYVLQKLQIKVDGKTVELDLLGHEYENDIVKIYIEAKDISEMKKIEVENKILTEMFDDQQNIIHVKKNKKRKSLILERDNPKGVLNFN